jgi:hypothetical protein
MQFEEILRNLGIDNQQILSFFTACSRVQAIGMEAENIAGTMLLTSSGHPALVRDLFIVDSLMEAACFAHCNQHLLARIDQVVMATVGWFPQYQQLQAILRRYPNARVHTVFPADLAGIVADCRVALCQRGTAGQFSFFGGKLLFQGLQATFEFDAYDFSLNKFQKRLDLAPFVQAHKPKRGYNSFFQVLKKW